MTVSIGLLETALDVLWVAWIIYWVTGEPLYRYARHKSKAALKSGRGRRNNMSYIFLMASFGVLQISFNELLAFLGESFLPDVAAVSLVGFVLGLGGLALSVYARLYLGSNWSPIAMLRKDQTLVRSGPYRIVRRPIYSGLTVAILGTAFVFGGYRVIISIACVFLFALVGFQRKKNSCQINLAKIMQNTRKK